MRIDPEIEEKVMNAARLAGGEKDYSYWRDLYLRELERSKEHESQWELDKIILWIASIGLFIFLVAKEFLHW